MQSYGEDDYLVRGNKGLEYAIELSGIHLLVVLAVVLHNFRVDRVRVVHVIHQVIDLRCGLPDKRPHLGSVTVSLFRVREVLCQLSTYCFQSFTQLSEPLPNILQAHWEKL